MNDTQLSIFFFFFLFYSLLVKNKCLADNFHVASQRLVGLQLKRILRMEPTVLFWLPQSEKLL